MHQMSEAISLKQYLHGWAGTDGIRLAVARTLAKLLNATVDLAKHGSLRKACQQSPVAALGLEEPTERIILNRTAPLVLMAGSLGGITPTENNTWIGSTLSLYPVTAAMLDTPLAPLVQAGAEPLAAAYVINGTISSLVLTLGTGTHLFVFDPSSSEYRLVCEQIQHNSVETATAHAYRQADQVPLFGNRGLFIAGRGNY